MPNDRAKIVFIGKFKVSFSILSINFNENLRVIFTLMKYHQENFWKIFTSTYINRTICPLEHLIYLTWFKRYEHFIWRRLYVIIFQSCYFKTKVPEWHFGNLAIWQFGILAFWHFGILAFWHFGNLAFWHFGIFSIGQFFIFYDFSHSIKCKNEHLI